MPTAKEIADAIATLGAADGATLMQMVQDDPNLARHILKAVPPGAASSEYYRDIGQDGGRVVEREEIRVGPELSASGGGAERAIERYSPKRQQQGIEEVTESLGRMLTEMTELARALRVIARAQGEPDDANERGRRDAEEEREGEEEAERRAKTGADKGRRPPTFPRGFNGDVSAALTGEGTLEMDVRQFFGLLQGHGSMAKANVVAKAGGALDMLDGADAFACQRLLGHCDAFVKGSYPERLLIQELAGIDAGVIRAVVKAVAA